MARSDCYSCIKQLEHAGRGSLTQGRAGWGPPTYTQRRQSQSEQKQTGRRRRSRDVPRGPGKAERLGRTEIVDWAVVGSQKQDGTGEAGDEIIEFPAEVHHLARRVQHRRCGIEPEIEKRWHGQIRESSRRQ